MLKRLFVILMIIPVLLFVLSISLYNLYSEDQNNNDDEENKTISIDDDDNLKGDLPIEKKHRPKAKVSVEGPFLEGEPLTFIVTVKDKDSNKHFFSYDWDSDGIYEVVHVSKSSVDHAWNENGNYTITILVEDTDKLSTTVKTSISIKDQSPSFTIQGKNEIEEGVEHQYAFVVNKKTPDSIKDILWDWDYKGEFKPSSEKGLSVTHKFLKDGEYIIAAKAIDSDDSFSIEQYKVKVLDLKPTAMLSGDTLLTEGQEGTFDASTSKSYPDTIKLYEWDFNFKKSFKASKTIGVSQRFSWQKSGTYTVAVRVTDSDDSTDIATLDVTVNHLNPQAKITGPQSINENEEGQFKVELTGPLPQKIVKTEWDFNYKNDFVPSTTAGFIITHAYQDDGNNLIAVRLTDDSGSIGIITFPIFVKDILLDAKIKAPDEALEGDDITFDASQSSSAPDIITKYEWDFNFKNTFKPSEDSGITVKHRFLDNGTYKIALKITDDDQRSIVTSHLIEIKDKSPQAKIEAPNTADEGDPVIFKGGSSYSYPDQIVKYEWDFSYSDTFMPSKVTSKEATYKWMKNGEYVVALRVTDDDKSTNVVLHKISILDKKPNPVITGPDSVVEGKKATFSAKKSTSFPDTITKYEWDFEYNDNFSPSAENSLEASHIWMKNGKYTIALRLTDNDGSTSLATHTINVEDNKPVPRFSIPKKITVGQKIVISGEQSTSSPDKIVKYEWDLNYKDNFKTRKEGKSIAISYTKAGKCKIALRVTDDDGSQVIEYKKITIEPKK